MARLELTACWKGSAIITPWLVVQIRPSLPSACLDPTADDAGHFASIRKSLDAGFRRHDQLGADYPIPSIEFLAGPNRLSYGGSGNQGRRGQSRGAQAMRAQEREQEFRAE